jgi:hypothetical protein
MKIYMQNRRKDKTLRNKERANERCAKRLAREDEDFRKKERARELDVKRSAREDKDFQFVCLILKQHPYKEKILEESQIGIPDLYAY